MQTKVMYANKRQEGYKSIGMAEEDGFKVSF